MTDKEKWLALLTEMGVVFTDDGREINIPAEGNSGYIGFCATVVFNEDGVFKEFGVWE